MVSDYRRWDAEGTVSSIVFDAVTPRADGVEQGVERVSVSFPAAFLAPSAVWS